MGGVHMRKGIRKNINTFAWVSSLMILILIISACSSNETNDTVGEAEETDATEEVTYVNSVEEIISNNCLSCHGSESPNMADFEQDEDKYVSEGKGPRLDDYENLLVIVDGSEAGAMMRRLDNGENTEDGEPGNMYVYLGSDDEEREENLETLKEWVGHWTLKRENELTDEDREMFKVAEE